jgi:hemerythrin-like domain-containing protein
MLPIGPMMIEHRLIERMINIASFKVKDFENSNNIDPVFIEQAVDFIRIYADKTHHGKEEDILFRELKKKKISDEHSKKMAELEKDHIFGRTTTRNIVEAKNRYQNGDDTALSDIIQNLKKLVDFYPKHIEKEDKHFFIPVMKYFSKEEQENMLNEGFDYDHKMIHKKYGWIVEEKENELEIKDIKMNKDWINFI